MSQKSSPALIAGFTLGAIVLLGAAVFVFGSDKWFKETYQFELNFQGTVKGLDIGAPVSFRGVRVGSVSKILLVSTESKQEPRIRVIIELEQQDTDKHSPQDDAKKVIHNLVDQGLRAQLGMQSFLTGKLFINLDFFDDAEVTPAKSSGDIMEIPTVPTDMEKLQKTFGTLIEEVQKLPIEEIFHNLNGTLANLETMSGNLKSDAIVKEFTAVVDDIRELISELNTGIEAMVGDIGATLDSTKILVDNVNQQVDPIAQELQGPAKAAHSAVAHLDAMLTDEKSPAHKMFADIEMTLESARNSLDQATQTFVQYETLASEDSQLQRDLNQALTELSMTAKSLRQLTDYLERHPEALIHGKSGN